MGARDATLEITHNETMYSVYYEDPDESSSNIFVQWSNSSYDRAGCDPMAGTVVFILFLMLACCWTTVLSTIEMMIKRRKCNGDTFVGFITFFFIATLITCFGAWNGLFCGGIGGLLAGIGCILLYLCAMFLL